MYNFTTNRGIIIWYVSWLLLVFWRVSSTGVYCFIKSKGYEYGGLVLVSLDTTHGELGERK